MKPMPSFFLLLIALLYSGCETPGRAYAKGHPELSPQQRKIFLERRVSDINAVAGLTKEQIRLALGEPTQIDAIDGSDAWIFIRSKSGGGNASGGTLGPQMETPGVGGSGMAPQMGPMERIEKGNVRTTIYFEEDRASRATVAYEPATE
jgi:outer membrane protein assembly factor BamE (lipoprotein component of BamABCDE complex)